MNKNLFRLIPKVDEILEINDIDILIDDYPRRIVIESIREELERVRRDIQEGATREYVELKIEKLPKNIKKHLKSRYSMSLRPVINGTGIVIHTNLGRSLMNEEIIKNLNKISTNYSNLEYDINTGKRGIRYSHLEEVITDITGAEAALVVNNNAAAVLLSLSSLAKGKEVIVSRGELVEIGGSFRIPEVMEKSGGILKEVGTTNKTHLEDYENAINEETGALLKVHTSNYRIQGFTSNVEAYQLKEISESYNIPIIEDLGSGILIDLRNYGLEYEPTVQNSIENGVDIVTFSGDKLLGGAQAGIIVGKKEYIDKMKSNPLTRALRVDKFTIGVLEQIFRYYYDEKEAIEKIPTLNMILSDYKFISEKAEYLYKEINKINNNYFKLELEDDYSQVGGGSLPLEKLKTRCVSIKPKKISVNELDNKFRSLEIPIIGRIKNDRLYIDLRTVSYEDINIIILGLKDIIKEVE